ncbi:MAG TPA: dienelactone hydrolase family protein [Acidobacteriaceae bacterium]
MATMHRSPGRPPVRVSDSTLAADIPADVLLRADLHIPSAPAGAVLFAHGSGSSRLSPRNQFVARELQKAGLATLLLDLLTESEEVLDQRTAHLRFDIDLLAKRLLYAVDWIRRHPVLGSVRLGCFGASTGAASALLAASEGRPFDAIVSRGGRPDLAGPALETVHAPVLLIVGGNDPTVLDLNRRAKARLNTRTRLAIVPGATHLFEEPGTLEQVAVLARLWFERWLAARAPSRSVA